VAAQGLVGPLRCWRLRDHQGAAYDRDLNGSQLTL
jgi:hypothetical protein